MEDDRKDVILWVAWMSRWNEPFPTHAYAVGVFDTPGAADEAGEKESSYRGRKYGFQHSPCHLDMLDIDIDATGLGEPPTQVFLCSVTHPGFGRHAERRHLVGLFTTYERAHAVAGTLYPVWDIVIEEWPVTRTAEEKSP